MTTIHGKPMRKKLSRLHSRVIQLHAGVARLLHDPIPVGIIRGGAAVDPAATQVNEDENTTVGEASGQTFMEIWMRFLLAKQGCGPV